MTIADMTPFEYALAFSSDRTLLSDNCVKRAGALGRLLCIKTDGEYAGFICTVSDNGTEIITYAFTKEHFRRKGVFKALCRHIFDTSVSNAELYIKEEHPLFREIDRCMKEIGCISCESLHFFSFDVCEDTNLEDMRKAFHAKECCTWLKRIGYNVYSFAEAQEEILEQVRDSNKTEFGNTLNSARFFGENAIHPLEDMSFAVVRNGRLEAYSLFAKGTDNSVILEQIASSAETRTSGVVMLALVASFERFFECGYSRCCFAIHPRNKGSDSLRKMIQDYFKVSETIMQIYYRPGDS